MISCALSNIRSLIRNCDHLVMNLCQNNYDVVLLTETWLNSKNELDPLLGIASSQYMSVRCDRIFKKGGGILLLMKNIFYLSTYSKNRSRIRTKSLFVI